MNKIVVVGFPHCGTTILRKIIGNSSEVYDYPYEVLKIPEDIDELQEKNVVIKFTYSGDDLSIYEDYKIVLIIKNPFDVFGSLNKRFKDRDYEPNHTIEDWVSYAQLFYNYQKNPVDNVFTVKYEDLFYSDYSQIKDLYKFLDLTFSDGIITMKRDSCIADTILDIPEDEPSNRLEGLGHGLYRTWQINSEFKNKTGESRIYLNKDQKEQLSNLDIVKQLGYM